MFNKIAWDAGRVKVMQRERGLRLALTQTVPKSLGAVRLIEGPLESPRGLPSLPLPRQHTCSGRGAHRVSMADVLPFPA